MKMKKFLAAFLAAATCLSATSTTAFAAKEKEFETAHQAVANMHAGLHIGNTFESIDFEDEWFSNDGVNPGWDENHQGRDLEVFEIAWGNPPVTKEYIAAIKNAGFDSVRLPTQMANHADKDANIYEPWLDRIQEVVDMILEQDMYCILNSGCDVWLHPEKESFAENSGKYAKLWKQIAVRFKDYDEKLLFEGTNETYGEGTDENGNYIQYWSWQPEGADFIEWHNRINELFVDTVRATGGNNRCRNLVLTTFGANIGPEGPNGRTEVFDDFRLPDDKYDDHLLIDLHYYDPIGFCFPDKDIPERATSEWGSEDDIQLLERDFAYMNTLQERTGAPIIIGEHGAVYKNNDDEIVEYLEAYLNQANKYGIAAFLFDPINAADGGTYIHWWDGSTYRDQNYGVFNRSEGKVGWTEIADAYILYSYQGKLPAPRLTGTKKGNSVTLTWNDLSGAYGYRVYEYNSKTGKYEQIAFISGNKKTIGNLTPGTHKYKVVPVAKYNGKNKNGSASNAVKVTVA